MKNYALTKETADRIVTKLKEAGYQNNSVRDNYTRYYKKQGDSVYIYKSLNAIHATKGTVGHGIISDHFSLPNGKAKKGEEERLDAWFLNGYTGKESITVSVSSFKYAEELPEDDEQEFSEGAKQRITVNKYERDPRARAECIRIHGYSCQVCNFDFETVYGELGKEYIHVHHLVPLKEIGEKYNVDPEKDLIPVCPNCHAMLHKSDNSGDLDKLKNVMAKERGQ